MLCHGRHLILLCPLLLITFLSQSQQRRRDTLILHFPLNSYRIRAEDSALLTRTFGQDNISPISITGYTDQTGTMAYNNRLSQQRAVAVFQYFHAPGGQVIGGGIAPTPELSDSENRRVEIVYDFIVKDEGARPRSDTVVRKDEQVVPARNDSIVVVKNGPGDTAATSDSTQPAAILALRQINFIVDTPIPTDSTRSILPEFATELRQYSDHHLEIDGFVNSVVPLRGAKDPLYILSVRRAKFIYDYLVQAGFDPGKLTYKGMGNASPVNPHPMTRKEMDANMRVEIRVF